MPPKKKPLVTTSHAAEEGGAFRWTLENERKLLILIQGRYLTGDDYERLLTVFPGTNLNGVRIKCSRFRVEQRNLYEQLGWQLPEGGAVLKRKNESSGKEGTNEGVGEHDTPSKKKRAKKAKKSEEEEVKSREEDELEVEVKGVKEENVEDEA